MKKFLLPLACLPILLFSQVYDDFDDGDFTHDPSWRGTPQTFIVNGDFQLQLYDSMAGLSYLSTPFIPKEEMEWRCWLRCSFSPSSNNHARLYLMSNEEDLRQPLDGFFLQFGESGSSDAIELFRQEGMEISSVCRGEEGMISSSFQVGIKVTRNPSGHWKLFVDPNGGTAFTLQSEGDDGLEIEAGYVGILCKYTKSNADKMYFDDLYAGPPVIDSQPPLMLSATADSDSTLLLVFDEPVDPANAEKADNYLVSDGIGHPSLVVQSESSVVRLYFNDRFLNGHPYLLSISGIKDLSGNIMLPAESEFLYYKPQTYDIVINEIMADPSPSIGLPEVEYIELFNRTGLLIKLQDWSLVIGSSTKSFGEVSIDPGGYLILGRAAAENNLGIFGPFYGFSSFSLTNSGQQLTLEDPNGRVISSVQYHQEWYRDAAKKDGGWSLEQINPDAVCSLGSNWIASTGPAGGTPGSENAVLSQVFAPPEVKRIEVSGDQNLLIQFSQVMDSSAVTKSILYHADAGVGYPVSAEAHNQMPESVSLTFADSFQEGEVYRLTIKKEARNCRGMQLFSDTVLSFGLPAKVESRDILINEILFNPLSDGVDYVELYNISEKVFNLSSLLLGTVKSKPPGPNDTDFYQVSERQLLFLPNEYIVLTSDPEVVRKQYYSPEPSGFFAMASFPSYNNAEGSCVLSDQDGNIIDALDYAEEMHYPLLNFYDGVALERTNFYGDTKDRSNWHSASESAGFGTPAYINSQYIGHQDISGEIEVSPEIFSPDNDGYHDLTSLIYRFETPGYSMSVDIYNSEGNLVRNLASNNYIGTKGMINWDGLQNDHTKAPIGIYVFFIQVFDLKGHVNQFKRTVVLASHL